MVLLVGFIEADGGVELTRVIGALVDCTLALNEFAADTDLTNGFVVVVLRLVVLAVAICLGA